MKDMNKSGVLIGIFGLALAGAFFVSWYVLHRGVEPAQDRIIEVVGQRYFYTPNRITVNHGDRITLLSEEVATSLVLDR